MKTRLNIITLAAIALTGAAAITTPSHAQSVNAGASGSVTPMPSTGIGSTSAGTTTGINGNAGVPNVTTPADPVRQGAAGINSAQAEATRTTGNAARDAQATIENRTARTGVPDANAAMDAPAAANEAARSANNAANRGARGVDRAEQDVTRQLNNEQANARANASGNLSAQ